MTVDEPPRLDEVQTAVVAHRGRVLRVLGGPGTGKTTTAVELAAARFRAGEVRPDQCLVLASTRVAAAAMRERVTARLGGTSTEPLARTFASLGFGLLRQAAALRGEPAPRLLSGPEQDVILGDLLAGHAHGLRTAPHWPERVGGALTTRGFRAELRDLLMRAVEHGLEPSDLARLGREHHRPEWVAAADVLAEYDEVTALSAPGAYDPAWIAGAASDLLADDGDAVARLQHQLRLVVVDDAHEMTTAAVRLLASVALPGVDVVLLGDPDSTVQGFRGADPRFLAHGWTSLGDGPTFVLPTAYRLASPVHAAAERVARKIGALGGAPQRRCRPGRAAGGVEVHLLRSVSQEAAFVAARLREAHLRDGLPWSQMAVIVRGRGRTATLRRVLASLEVPVSASETDLPVRDEVAVRPLLLLLEAVLDLARGRRATLDPQVAVDVLSSPIGAMDAVSLRRLRRSLRRLELESGGGRSSDELIAEAVVEPGRLIDLGPEALPARRVARMIAAGLDAAGTAGAADRDGADRDAKPADPGHWAPGVTAEQVLWAMWEASGLAPVWEEVALEGGSAGARADRDLDAVVALFDAAGRFVDRLPELGPDAFLDHVLGQDVPGDTLVARSPAGESVSILTPQAAAGREWALVAVAGVQEGVWPDLRLRGSLLGSEQLVDVVTGRGGSFRAAQAAVRYDETRLFLVALTRARERVLVTAVRSDDEQPSVYLDVVDPPDDADDATRAFTEAPSTMTLPGIVSQLRRELLDASPHVRGRAVHGLVRLASAGVPGADPAQWWEMRELSDDRPLCPPDQPVTVSPSKVESFHRCGLRWLLTACGGEGPPVGAAAIGTLVHEVVAEVGDAGAPALREEVDARWGRLGLRDGWVSDRTRREAHEMVTRVARYAQEATAEGWRRAGAEVSMRVALGRAVLAGRVDRLEQHDDGSARVIDYKTGSSKPSRADLARHPQLGAYQVAIVAGAFPQIGTRSAGAALLQVGKAANVRTTLQLQPALASDEDPDWAEQLVRETADGMSVGTFTATEGDWCTLCQVRSSCPIQPEGKVV